MATKANVGKCGDKRTLAHNVLGTVRNIVIIQKIQHIHHATITESSYRMFFLVLMVPLIACAWVLRSGKLQRSFSPSCMALPSSCPVTSSKFSPKSNTGKLFSSTCLFQTSALLTISARAPVTCTHNNVHFYRVFAKPLKDSGV